MSSKTPIPDFLAPLMQRAQGLVAPSQPWVRGVQHRLVLLINHVLMQEPEAMQRLQRQKGQVLVLQWEALKLQCGITPAGLLELVSEGSDASDENAGTKSPSPRVDLQLSLIPASPLSLARSVLSGEKPPVRIEGNVQLAAEINWIVEHVRWDIEEDLSRLLGDGPAYALVQAARTGANALREFVQRWPLTSVVRDQDHSKDRS